MKKTKGLQLKIKFNLSKTAGKFRIVRFLTAKFTITLPFTRCINRSCFNLRAAARASFSGRREVVLSLSLEIRASCPSRSLDASSVEMTIKSRTILQNIKRHFEKKGSKGLY